ncbi:MAG: hypothetical protein ABIV93_01985 [Byssovorax sp.]
MDEWKSYLFSQHSEETLTAWARKLAMFRFCRAVGGHAQDGDFLGVAFRYESEAQLLSFFRRVGREPVVYRSKPPQPVRGKSYPKAEFDAFPSLIEGTCWIEQPGHCTLFGSKVFLWCGNGQINIRVGSGYDVMPDDFEKAAFLEPYLEDLPFERFEPPQDNKYCICPKYYPEYFVQRIR